MLLIRFGKAASTDGYRGERVEYTSNSSGSSAVEQGRQDVVRELEAKEEPQAIRIRRRVLGSVGPQEAAEAKERDRLVILGVVVRAYAAMILRKTSEWGCNKLHTI